MDFSSSVSKFEKEAEKRKKAAKEKQRNEAIARRRQAALEKEREELARARREEQEREQQERERLELMEARLTGGVRFLEELRVVYLEGEDDRVVLPQSALETLMNQNAFDLGPMCFRISLSPSSKSGGESGTDYRASHCGVREFTAVEGTIQIPLKVLGSLGITERIPKDNLNTQDEDHLLQKEAKGTDENQEEDKVTGVKRPPSISAPVHITLKYVTLPKVTSVRIQPVHNLFAQVGPIKLVLEENLRHHSTLSMGDRLTVYYRGVEHTLIVKDLSLDSDAAVDAMDEDDGSNLKVTESETECRGGTLINTDVVVDIDISEEYLKSQEPDQKEQHRLESVTGGNTIQGRSAMNGSILSSSGGTGRILGTAESSPSLPSTQTAGTTSSSSVSSFPIKTDYDMNLDEEPAAGGSGVITCKVKTPQGKTFTRRFNKSNPLRQLFAFVRLVLQTHQLPSPGEGEALQLSTRQPARKFSEVEVCSPASPLSTFSSAGIESNNEMFFVAFV